ncbi:MAG: hypothetical protein JNL62_24980, partial [Bryobacterales bacterium]|nr:hypothetical protein [Bryobacterales bacterium]
MKKITLKQGGWCVMVKQPGGKFSVALSGNGYGPFLGTEAAAKSFSR